MVFEFGETAKDENQQRGRYRGGKYFSPSIVYTSMRKEGEQRVLIAYLFYER